MAIGKEPHSDERNERITIRLGETEEVKTVESYNFHSSVLQQPAAFALTLSGGLGASAVLKKYPPGPKGSCSLYIGSSRQFTGRLDAPDAHGDANSTIVDLKGRDLLALIHDADILGERSFDGVTYEALFKEALKAVGQGDKKVTISDKANVQVRTGTKVKIYREPVVTDEVVQVATGGNDKFRNVVTAKMGETWLQFLTRHFNKIGLFPWATADGNYILSRPNGDQEPLYHFYRARGNGTSVANVKKFSYTNDTTHRFSEIVVFCRNFGRKYGHNHTNSGFVDEEMKALGIDRVRVYRDADVSNVEEAEFYARRQIAEINRAAWRLQYTISGHTAPRMGEIDERVIVSPNTVARVDDDDLGIHQNLYVESVEHRSPPRETVITMMRPQDLLFGENQAIVAAKKAAEAAKQANANRPTAKLDSVKEDEYTNYFRTFIANIPKKTTGDY